MVQHWHRQCFIASLLSFFLLGSNVNSFCYRPISQRSSESSSDAGVTSRSFTVSIDKEPLPPILIRFQQDLQLNGRGERTQQSYVRNVRKFAEFLNRDPDTASADLPWFRTERAATIYGVRYELGNERGSLAGGVPHPAFGTPLPRAGARGRGGRVQGLNDA